MMGQGGGGNLTSAATPGLAHPDLRADQDISKDRRHQRLETPRLRGQIYFGGLCLRTDRWHLGLRTFP